MSNKREQLAKILREEYGITTVRELDEAISKLGTIDLSIFCVKPESSKTGRRRKKTDASRFEQSGSNFG